jgi:hypothetical protein
MFVAVRNAGAANRSRGAILARAIAGHGRDAFGCARAFDGFFSGIARQFFFFGGLLDGLPSRAAAQRTIRLRHGASIGATQKLRKLSRPVESAADVEKQEDGTTDEHRHTQMKDKTKERQNLHATEKAKQQY